jgi:hypothetical protein
MHKVDLQRVALVLDLIQPAPELCPAVGIVEAPIVFEADRVPIQGEWSFPGEGEFTDAGRRIGDGKIAKRQGRGNDPVCPLRKSPIDGGAAQLADPDVASSLREQSFSL